MADSQGNTRLTAQSNQVAAQYLRAHLEDLFNKPAGEGAFYLRSELEPKIKQLIKEIKMNQNVNKSQVRAKFQVNSKEERLAYGGAKETVVKMTPVNQGSEENREFYAATPSGHIDLGTVSREAANYFEFGKEYYVDFTEAK